MTTPTVKSPYLKRHEICSLVEVKPYVLRFWESEFPEIAPLNSLSGEKLYQKRDLEVLLLIKKLLFDEKLTVEQAKGRVALSSQKNGEQASARNDAWDPSPSLKAPSPTLKAKQAPEHLLAVREKLNELLDLTESLQDRHHWG